MAFGKIEKTAVSRSQGEIEDCGSRCDDSVRGISVKLVGKFTGNASDFRAYGNLTYTW